MNTKSKVKAMAKPKCAVCLKEAGPEDRCSDGLYLHRNCAYQASTR